MSKLVQKCQNLSKLVNFNSFFLPFQWRYSIRLENLGEQAVTLRERNWRIFSLSGTLETVRGRGVVGHEPVLNQEQPAFQYSSHVSLQAPSGHMWYVLHYLIICFIYSYILTLLGGPDKVGRWSKETCVQIQLKYRVSHNATI